MSFENAFLTNEGSISIRSELDSVAISSNTSGLVLSSVDRLEKAFDNIISTLRGMEEPECKVLLPNTVELGTIKYRVYRERTEREKYALLTESLRRECISPEEAANLLDKFNRCKNV